MEEDYEYKDDEIEVNVFDTQAAYDVAASFMVDMDISSHVPLRTIVGEYLGVESAHLPLHDPLDAESMPELIMNLAREAMYLIPLYHVFQQALTLKGSVVCGALIQDTLDATAEEAAEIFMSPECVPRDLNKHCLPLHFGQ